MRNDIRRSRITSILSTSTQFGYAPQPAIPRPPSDWADRRTKHTAGPSTAGRRAESASWTTRSTAKRIVRPCPSRWFSRWKATTPSAVVARATSSRASSGERIRLTPLSVFPSSTLASGSDIPCPYSQAAARIGCGISGSGQASSFRKGVQNRLVGDKRHVSRVEMGVVHGAPSPRISTSQRMLPRPAVCARSIRTAAESFDERGFAETPTRRRALSFVAQLLPARHPSTIVSPVIGSVSLSISMPAIRPSGERIARRLPDWTRHPGLPASAAAPTWTASTTRSNAIARTEVFMV